MSRRVNLGPVSAYAIAVEHGFVGTEEEWIAYVQGNGAHLDELEDDIDEVLARQEILAEEIPNTVRAYTFSSDGLLTQVLHKRGTATIRTDAYVYTTGSVTETRTLNTGAVMTIVTNTETLQTTVTYTAAS